MCVGPALIRGLVRHDTDQLGNFWVDLPRCFLRVLLPLSILFGLVLVGLGVEQNLGGAHTVATLAGGSQTLIGGPIGSWEPIKLMSGDGGGFFSANSAHPFENPSAWANMIEIVLMLLIPTAFLRMYGRLVGSRKQGWTLLVIVGILFVLATVAAGLAQHAHSETASLAAGAATEGTETRFGVQSSALFGVAATNSADGAANASYDSFTSLGGGVLMAGMMLGEISPGGTGSGLYGLLMAVLVAVFIGGLMVGRTPEYLRKRIGTAEMKMVVLYALVAPAVILLSSALAIASPAGRAAMGNAGPRGLSEIIYAFTSNVNTNGSAFGGLSANTPFYNITMSVAMLVGRYLPIGLVLALAGMLARQRPGVVIVGTPPARARHQFRRVGHRVGDVAGTTELPAGTVVRPVSRGTALTGHQLFVVGFDQDRWDACRYEIVLAGSIAKFDQHPNLRRFLLNTGERVLVEASPLDRVWGIGLTADDPRASRPEQWRGLNLLGFALTEA